MRASVHSEHGDSCHRAVAILGASMILAFVTAVAACSPSGSRRTGQYTPTAQPSEPAGWHQYHDPGGYFTIALPPGWQLKDTPTIGHGTQGDPQGSANTTTVISTFIPLTGELQTVPPRLGVSVTYTLYTDISGMYGERELCGMYLKSDTTIAGLRAVTVHPLAWHEWDIATSVATYALAYGLPSDRPGTSETAQPSPIPLATVNADQQLAMAILATFTPVPATPPKC